MRFFDWLLGGSSPGRRTVGKKDGNFLESAEGYEVHELLIKEGLEYGLRKAAFYGCVNVIANYLGNAEMRFFQAGKEKKGNEWYRWNYEPNRNQNASAFWHELVTRLYEDGEVLIIDEPYGEGFVIADSFEADDTEPATVYRGVTWRNRTRDRVGVSNAMHIVLNGEIHQAGQRGHEQLHFRRRPALEGRHPGHGAEHGRGDRDLPEDRGHPDEALLRDHQRRAAGVGRL